MLRGIPQVNRGVRWETETIVRPIPKSPEVLRVAGAGWETHPDGSRWVSCRGDFFLPVRVLASLFRGKFLAFLQKAERARTLRFAGATAGLATPVGFAAFLQAQRDHSWVVYAKAPFGSPELVLKYLARYTHRVAISDRRILAIDDAGVTFRYRDNAAGGQRSMTLGGEEFLRRFLLHVLPTGFVRIRYYGLLANRHRAQNLTRCRTLLAATGQLAPTSSKATVTESRAADADERGRCTACDVGLLRLVGPLPAIPNPDPGSLGPSIARDTS